MNGELRQISVWELCGLLRLPSAEMKPTLDWARESDPLLAGMYTGELLCVLGLVPAPDRTYLWMTTTKAGLQHPLILGRWARRWIPTLPKPLVGHCSPASTRWLESLGAKILGNEFAIGVT
jgi:hypothetical protein